MFFKNVHDFERFTNLFKIWIRQKIMNSKNVFPFRESSQIWSCTHEFKNKSGTQKNFNLIHTFKKTKINCINSKKI